jgi:hypothetical protein
VDGWEGDGEQRRSERQEDGLAEYLMWYWVARGLGCVKIQSLFLFHGNECVSKAQYSGMF